MQPQPQPQPQQLATLRRPLTPPADSPDSSFSASSEHDQSTVTSQSRFSPPTSLSCQDRCKGPIQSEGRKSTVIDNEHLHVAQSLEDKLRKYQKGDRNIASKHSIGPHAFLKLENTINTLPDTDPLKAFWADKLHYEYDSSTEIFRILMPTAIHERLKVSISKQINDWLLELQRQESVCVHQYASVVVEQGSTRIEYSSDKVSGAASVEEILGSVSPSEPKSDSSFSEDLSIQTRNQSEFPRFRSDDARERQHRAPADRVQREQSTSAALDSGTQERRYDPDNSWCFIAPPHEDKRPAFVLEVAKTQSEDDLHNKIEGLLRQCEATAVLACRTDIPNSKRACIELWRSSHESGNPSQLAWSADILDDRGMVPSHFPRTPLSITDFATEDSASSFLEQYSDEDIQPWLDHEFLFLDFVKLGSELIELRERECKEKENKKRKRSQDSTEDEPKDGAESVRKQALRQKIRASKRRGG